MPDDFSAFFQAATGPGRTPYDYQQRLASLPCESRLINIPTGLGKTAAVILAWLWNRVGHPDKTHRSKWPRRLVYCLPMRTLVEQTRDEATKWIETLVEKDHINKDKAPRVVILMGGEEPGEDSKNWDLYPEENAIIIGTQDMLLSRALTRGYASSRAKWPMESGLLNQDCLWSMDEVQLMDVGLATSAQLQAFRDNDQKAGKLIRPCVTWWMSATLQPNWLESVDTRLMVTDLRESVISIPAKERKEGPWKISKPCSLVPLKDTKAWASKAWETHLQRAVCEHGRVTLIIANTVRTAREIYAGLETQRTKAKNKNVELRLIHSRFRGMERRGWRNEFLQRSACHHDADRIIVATQVVEAGVDISATTLFTELAPWASLVQRFGRAARYGGSANVFIVDRNPSEKAALPYQLSELESSRNALALLPDASLSGLYKFDVEHADLVPSLFPYSPTHLLLRREFEELVDTTPDLSGADLDISRFIRNGEERDVQVFWRNVPLRTKPDKTIRAARDELCAISIGDARDWIKEGAKSKAWVWDYLDGMWRQCYKEDVYPGQIILVAHDVGGYKVEIGWTGEVSDRDFPVSNASVSASDRRAADAALESEATSQRQWETIAAHGAHVARVIESMATVIELSPAITHILKTSALWHDVGKGHPAFQGCILPTAELHPGTADIAKAPKKAWVSPGKMYSFNGDQRRGFRHELASTLALFTVLERHAPNHPSLIGNYHELLTAMGHALPELASSITVTLPERDILDLDQPSFDLLAYLTCAHHGKVRGAWHAAPADQEYRSRDERGQPIHGVREGDLIPALAVTAADGTEHIVAEITLHLEPARIGLSSRTGASWAERVSGLLHKHGPFALTYLEALLRAADIRASKSLATESADEL